MQSITAQNKINVMNKKNTSLYFDSVERFMYATPCNCSIAVLNNIAKNHGCAENLVDQVINGVIIDFIMNIIAPKDKKTKVLDLEGKEILDNRVNPSYQELMDILTKEKFSDLSITRADKLIGYLIQKYALTIESDGTMFKTKTLLPHQFVQL